MLCAIWTPERIFISNKTYHFCYQKDRISSRSVSVCSYMLYDALFAHRRGCGDKQKNVNFYACHLQSYFVACNPSYIRTCFMGENRRIYTEHLHGLTSVHIKIYNTNTDACTPSSMCDGLRGGVLVKVNFYCWSPWPLQCSCDAS